MRRIDTLLKRNTQLLFVYKILTPIRRKWAVHNEDELYLKNKGCRGGGEDFGDVWNMCNTCLSVPVPSSLSLSYENGFGP